MRVVLLAAFFTTIAGASLDAHGADHTLTAPRALSPFDVAVIAVLLAMAMLFVAGIIRLRRAGAHHRPLEEVAFGAGWLALIAAVLPPLDRLAIELFSVHMAQHELMMLVAAPLMMAGRPLPVWLMALPHAPRRFAASALQSRTTVLGWRLLSAPLVAWALHGGAIWLWHLPVLYDLAVSNEAVHAVQHATFVGTSMLFWWGMLYGRYGRAGYGAAVFYVFTTAVHTGILGAMVTFAGSPLFDVYIAPAAVRGVDVLGDQQLAGLVMWIPAGFVLTLLGIALFAAWLGEAERRNRAGAFRRPGSVAVILVLCGAAVTGCSRNQDSERVARELTGGEPQRGRIVLAQYGCDTCHTIPGVRTATATVGPPLTQIARRAYLAGRIENTPENMIQWIRQPHTVDPETAMPETGVTARDGRDIAAYLYTLR
jgi:putative membrane protein